MLFKLHQAAMQNVDTFIHKYSADSESNETENLQFFKWLI